MAEVIDGKNTVLGRLATFVAKELLKGNEVSVVNVEKVIITGSPKKIVGNYLKKRRIGSPHHGPFFPKKPDLILRRTVRGMLPKTSRGRNAFKKLRVYIDIPKDIEKKDMKSIGEKEVKTNFISLGELAKSLGWRN
jgi:large subunit ribosomal protein L13